MREAELNRQRVVFTPQEAARLPQDRPYAAYICHYDWAEGEHATLMHCHERLAEVLLILKGSGRYTVDLRRYEVAAGDVVLCSGGALHDEFPQADQPYQTLCVAIGNLALADLPPYSLLSPDRCPLFHQPEQFADLKELFCLMDRYAAEREPGFQELCQHLMLASLELVRRMAAGRKEDLVTREDSTFGRVARYIDRHYAEDLSIEQLARQFYLSPYHLSHIFRQKTGYSLKQYVLRRRIGEAQMRLVNGNWQIFRVGFTPRVEKAHDALSEKKQRHRRPRIPSALGYRFGHGYTILRKHNLFRLKRALHTYYHRRDRNRVISFKRASGLISRLGQLRNCNSQRILERYYQPNTMFNLKKVVRRECRRLQRLYPPYRAA